MVPRNNKRRPDFRHVFDRPSGLPRPAFNPHAEVTHEKVFEIETTTPGMIGFKVTIILPLSPGEKVGSPQTEVKLVIGVPLRARRRCCLLQFFSGIGFSGKSYRRDHPKPEQA